MAAVIEEGAVGGEDPVGEPVIAQELPDILDRVQFRAFWGNGKRVMLAGTMSLSDRCHPA